MHRGGAWAVAVYVYENVQPLSLCACYCVRKHLLVYEVESYWRESGFSAVRSNVRRRLLTYTKTAARFSRTLAVVLVLGPEVTPPRRAPVFPVFMSLRSGTVRILVRECTRALDNMMSVLSALADVTPLDGLPVGNLCGCLCVSALVLWTT
jgi:hypothetical protein